jgi:hypothetical protein
MGVHPFRNILIPKPSRVKQDSCKIFLYSGVKTGTVIQPQKQEHFFFPAGNFKILRISEENYTLLYFTKKYSCLKTGKCNLDCRHCGEIRVGGHWCKQLVALQGG